MLLCNETGMFLGGVTTIVQINVVFFDYQVRKQIPRKKKIGIYYFQNTIFIRF